MQDPEVAKVNRLGMLTQLRLCTLFKTYSLTFRCFPLYLGGSQSIMGLSKTGCVRSKNGARCVLTVVIM